MWSDKESSIDYLNFNETAESVKDLITDKELMPISVGIFGNWGAGKSTILELTKNPLKEIITKKKSTYKFISMLGLSKVLMMQKLPYWRQ